jgi:hypothetical protein
MVAMTFYRVSDRDYGIAPDAEPNIGLLALNATRLVFAPHRYARHRSLLSRKLLRTLLFSTKATLTS